jgi:glycosyltransferase involved in cell wall biosynthesis
MMPDKKNKTVCMISCCHPLLDDRIYKKEALTLARNGYTVIHIGYGDGTKDCLTDNGVRLIQLKRTKIKQLTLCDLYQAAKAVKADVYHLHDVELCRIALKLKRLPWHPKVIYDAHEPYNVFLKDTWYKRSLKRLLLIDIPAVWAESRILSRIDFLIATEENVASRFRKKNPNTAIIYNYSYFSPKDYPSKEEDKTFDAIYCGSISEGKGIFLMLNVLIATKKQGHNFKIVIVGNCHNPAIQSKIDTIVREEQLNDNILFTGELALEEITHYYRTSKTAFCLFSFNKTNSLILPIKLFEYAAFGLPVIGSDFGHIAEIIQSNGIGICVNPHNAETVASAWIDLISGDNYKSYERLCKDCARMNYLWKYQEEKLARIYVELLYE